MARSARSPDSVRLSIPGVQPSRQRSRPSPTQIRAGSLSPDPIAPGVGTSRNSASTTGGTSRRSITADSSERRLVPSGVPRRHVASGDPFAGAPCRLAVSDQHDVRHPSQDNGRVYFTRTAVNGKSHFSVPPNLVWQLRLPAGLQVAGSITHGHPRCRPRRHGHIGQGPAARVPHQHAGPHRHVDTGNPVLCVAGAGW